MKFGFSTYFFMEKGALYAIDEAMIHGVRVFELSLEIPHGLAMDEAFCRRIDSLRDGGIEFSMHAPFFEINPGSFFGEIRSFTMHRIKDALRMAGRLGANPVVVHPGYTFLGDKAKQITEKARADFIDDLGEITGYAREQGVTVALENIHMPFFFFHNLEDFAPIHEHVPAVGMTLDVGHAYIALKTKKVSDPEGAILSGIERTGIERLTHVHLSNNKGTRDEHKFLEGHIDLGRVIRGLDMLGYTGKFIVESYDMEQYGMEGVVARLATFSE